MAEDDKSQRLENKPAVRKLLGKDTVLPQDDRALVPDEQFQQNRTRLIDRSKIQFWWKSISRVFNMVAAMLIPAAIGVITGGLVHGGGTLTAPMLTTVAIIGGVAAVSLAIGIGTDYFENIVNQNQSFDTNDLTGKRQATNLARALDEVSQQREGEPNPSLADKLRPQGKASWEAREIIRDDIHPGSQTIN